MFWVFLLGYAGYSWVGFRIAIRGRQALSNNAPRTAGAAFNIVLEKYSYSLAAPMARTGLLRIANEHTDGYAETEVSASNVPLEGLALELREQLRSWTGGRLSGHSPDRADMMNCDPLPLVIAFAACCNALLLCLAFFVRTPEGYSHRIGYLFVSLIVLAWFWADTYLGWTTMFSNWCLLKGGPMLYAHMGYHYLKYLVMLLQAWGILSKWTHARLPGIAGSRTQSSPDRLPGNAIAATVR